VGRRSIDIRGEDSGANFQSTDAAAPAGPGRAAGAPAAPHQRPHEHDARPSSPTSGKIARSNSRCCRLQEAKWVTCPYPIGAQIDPFKCGLVIGQPTGTAVHIGGSVCVLLGSSLSLRAMPYARVG